MRIAEAEVEPGDAYYVVCRMEDRIRPDVRALLGWALSELRR